MINISAEFLASVLETDVEQVTKAIKDGENFKSEEEISDWLKESIDSKVHSARRDVRDKLYSRGKKEALTAKERELAEKHGLTGTLDEMIQTLQDAAKATPDMTPDAVRNTEIYKLEQQKWMSEAKDAKDLAATIQQTYASKEIGFKSRQIGAKLLNDNNFVTPDGVANESMWKDFLYQNLEGPDTKISLNKEGVLIVVDSSGNEKIDAKTVTAITFEDHFLSVAANMFKVAKSDQRKSPGNSGAGFAGGAPPAPKGAAPNSHDEFMSGMMAQEGAEAKKAYIATFGSKFGVQ